VKIRMLVLTAVFLSSVSFAADKSPASPGAHPPLQITKNQDISQIKPRKPVKIKLHRTAKGEYQWEISGDNADDIIRADRRLRKLLGIE